MLFFFVQQAQRLTGKYGEQNLKYDSPYLLIQWYGRIYNRLQYIFFLRNKDVLF